MKVEYGSNSAVVFLLAGITLIAQCSTLYLCFVLDDDNDHTSLPKDTCCRRRRLQTADAGDANVVSKGSSSGNLSTLIGSELDQVSNLIQLDRKRSIRELNKLNDSTANSCHWSCTEFATYIFRPGIHSSDQNDFSRQPCCRYLVLPLMLPLQVNTKVFCCCMSLLVHCGTFH